MPLDNVVPLPETCLYIIGHDRAGPLKIGITRALRGRLAKLQTAHHERLTVYWFANWHDAPQWEKHMHAALAPWRLEGEWFAVPLEMAFEAAMHLMCPLLAPDQYALPDTAEWARLLDWPETEEA